MSTPPPNADPNRDDWSEKKPDQANYPRLKRDPPARDFDDDDDGPRKKKKGVGVAGGIGIALVVVLILLRVIAAGINSSSSSSSSSSYQNAMNLSIAQSNADIGLQNMRHTTTPATLAAAIPAAVNYANQLKQLEPANQQAARNLTELKRAAACAKLYQQAAACADQEDYVGSLPLYAAALTEYDQVGCIWYDYTDALLALQRTDDAFALVQRGAKVLPNDSMLRLAYGRVLFDQQKYDEACAQFERSTKDNDQQTLAWYFWGHSLVNLKRQADAEAKLVRAVRLEGHNAGILNVYGISLLEQEKWDAAAKQFAQAVKIHEAAPAIWFNWALACSGKKDYASAVEKTKKALEYDADNELYQNHLAFFQNKLKYPNALGDDAQNAQNDENDADNEAPPAPAPAPAPAP